MEIAVYVLPVLAILIQNGFRNYVYGKAELRFIKGRVRFIDTTMKLINRQ